MAQGGGKRGLLNLRSTPDALPELISDQTVAAFSNYGVLDERELHARYDVMLEQYIITVNTEAETAADIAATMILPAAARHLVLLKEAGLTALAKEAPGWSPTSARPSRPCRTPTSTTPRA